MTRKESADSNSQEPSAEYQWLYNEAVSADEAGELVAAKVAYMKLLALDPEHMAARFNLGSVLLHSGELPEAVREYDELTVRHPDFAPGWFMAGVAHAAVEDWDASIRATQQGLELMPDSAEAWFNLGRSQAFAGQFDAAVKSFSESMDIEPGNPDAFMAIGTVHAWRTVPESRTALVLLEPRGEFDLESPEHLVRFALGKLVVGSGEGLADDLETLEASHQAYADLLRKFLGR